MKKRSSLIAGSFVSLACLGPLAGLSCSHGVASAAGTDPTPAAAERAPGAAPQALDLYRVPIAGLPTIGNPDALVTIVEFTDYQCPFCQRADQTIARLRATFGDALKVVVAARPLPFHDRSRPAAFAALAADAQGKFEAMHARLFALGGGLTEEAIVQAARDSGLDLARFERDRSAAPLALSEQLADHVGIRGTPTFFVSGRRIVGAQAYETFRDVVEERLAAARALVASGTRARDVYAALTADGADHIAEDPKGDASDGPGCGRNCNEAPDEHGDPDKVEAVPTDGAPARGAARARATIVTFSDFECPFSAQVESTLRALDAAHPGELRFVFKNRPLPMHPHARLAALGALAADAQGRFWDFHDRLFARSGAALDRPALLKVAADLDLDVARFASDLDDPKLAAKVARDDADAEALSVRGTPTSFVNGRRVMGAQPLSLFEAAIAKAR